MAGPTHPDQPRPTGSSEPDPSDRAVPRRDDRARYGLTVALAASLVIWLVAGPEYSPRWYLTITCVVAAGLLLASSWSARVLRRRRIRSIAGAAASIVAALIAATAPKEAAVHVTVVLLLFVCSYAPYTVAFGLLRRRRVDMQTIMGAVTIYFMLGLVATMVLAIAGTLDPTPILRIDGAPDDGDIRDQIYFSFVTMSTVGYGDIAPNSPSARAIAMMTAMTGQLYLGIAIATAASMFGASRMSAERGS